MTLLVLLDVFRRCDNLWKTRFPPVEKQRVLYSATRFRRFFRPLTKYQRTFNPTTKPQHRKHSVGRLTGPRLLLLLLEEKQDPLGHPSTSTFTAVVGFERNCINTLIIYSPSPQKKKKKNLQSSALFYSNCAETGEKCFNTFPSLIRTKKIMRTQFPCPFKDYFYPLVTVFHVPALPLQIAKTCSFISRELPGRHKIVKFIFRLKRKCASNIRRFCIWQSDTLFYYKHVSRRYM